MGMIQLEFKGAVHEKTKPLSFREHGTHSFNALQRAVCFSCPHSKQGAQVIFHTDIIHVKGCRRWRVARQQTPRWQPNERVAAAEHRWRQSFTANSLPSSANSSESVVPGGPNSPKIQTYLWIHSLRHPSKARQALVFWLIDFLSFLIPSSFCAVSSTFISL